MPNIFIFKTAHKNLARGFASCALTLALIFSSLIFVNAQQPRRSTRERTGGPAAATSRISSNSRARLVLLIVVDQFRYDYLERFSDLFGNDGLRKLQREGSLWTDANYDHIPTETAPGHATMMTGAWPAETGIVGNEWFDRETGKKVMNVEDKKAKLFGGGEKEEASSPHLLLASTLGDELRLATVGRSKVIGISVKDRGAILPAGRNASAAYWYSKQTGRMVSSSYYFKELPAWVQRFNDTRPAEKYFGAKWERLLPEAEYVKRAGADSVAWEILDPKDKMKDTVAFPHVITGGASKPDKDFYEALNFSPFSNDLLVSFTEQALISEGLGADDDTDVLSVSFSANDYVGHRFGPYSHEVMDMTLRLDRQIATLLKLIDERVGLGNTLIAFTADHGVAPVPEHAAELNLDGGRVKSGDIDEAISKALNARYNRGGDNRDRMKDYIQSTENENVYFNLAALERDGIRREEIERVVGDAVLTVPGISRYFTRTQLQGGAVSPADPIARRVLHGFHPKRSGDVIIIQEPFKTFINSKKKDITTATHGTPYSYDTHVPVILMGRGIAAGNRFAHPAAPSDIAPTLAVLLRVQRPSNATGRVLLEGLKEETSNGTNATRDLGISR